MIALHPFQNNFNSLEKEVRIFSSINTWLRSVSNQIQLIFISVVLVFFILLFSPVIYLILTLQLRQTNQNLARIKAELPHLSISELNQIKAQFSGIIQNKESFSKLKNSPVILKPFLLIISHAAEQCMDTATLIDKQIEADLKLFESALETDTPIGF